MLQYYPRLIEFRSINNSLHLRITVLKSSDICAGCAQSARASLLHPPPQHSGLSRDGVTVLPLRFGHIRQLLDLESAARGGAELGRAVLDGALLDGALLGGGVFDTELGGTELGGTELGSAELRIGDAWESDASGAVVCVIVGGACHIAEVGVLARHGRGNVAGFPKTEAIGAGLAGQTIMLDVSLMCGISFGSYPPHENLRSNQTDSLC